MKTKLENLKKELNHQLDEYRAGDRTKEGHDKMRDVLQKVKNINIVLNLINNHGEDSEPVKRAVEYYNL